MNTSRTPSIFDEITNGLMNFDFISGPVRNCCITKLYQFVDLINYKAISKTPAHLRQLISRKKASDFHQTNEYTLLWLG